MQFQEIPPPVEYPDPRQDPDGFRRKVYDNSSWANRLITNDIMDIEIEDLDNPHNRFELLRFHPHCFMEWLGANSLLATSIVCPVGECRKLCTINARESAIEGFSWRCRPGGLHEHSVRKYSFFSHSHLLLQDIFLFLCSYAEQNGTLRRIALWSGVDYARTAVDWGGFIRDMFVQWVHDLMQNSKLSGEVEVDESLFGRKVKAHRGNPKKGRQVWVVGLVERRTNNLLLFPVDDRTKDTLHGIIERHVVPGSKVYTDGWKGYYGLNAAGFKHFTVNHKHSFRVDYYNAETGATERVHTNRIEGAWKHAKTHFRRMNGTSLANFESHLAEIIWRNRHKHHPIQALLNLVSTIYTLDGPPRLNAPHPLFPTWKHMTKEDLAPATEENSKTVFRIHRADSSSDEDDMSCYSEEVLAPTPPPLPSPKLARPQDVPAPTSPSAITPEAKGSRLLFVKMQRTDQVESFKAPPNCADNKTLTSSSSPPSVGHDGIQCMPKVGCTPSGSTCSSNIACSSHQKSTTSSAANEIKTLPLLSSDLDEGRTGEAIPLSEDSGVNLYMASQTSILSPLSPVDRSFEHILDLFQGTDRTNSTGTAAHAAPTNFHVQPAEAATFKIPISPAGSLNSLGSSSENSPSTTCSSIKPKSLKRPKPTLRGFGKTRLLPGTTPSYRMRPSGVVAATSTESNSSVHSSPLPSFSSLLHPLAASTPAHDTHTCSENIPPKRKRSPSHQRHPSLTSVEDRSMPSLMLAKALRSDSDPEPLKVPATGVCTSSAITVSSDSSTEGTALRSSNSLRKLPARKPVPKRRVKAAGQCPEGYEPLPRPVVRTVTKKSKSPTVNTSWTPTVSSDSCLDNLFIPDKTVTTIPPSTIKLPVFTPRQAHKERTRLARFHKHQVASHVGAHAGGGECSYPACACMGVNGAKTVKCTEASTGVVLTDIGRCTDTHATHEQGTVRCGTGNARSRVLRRGGAGRGVRGASVKSGTKASATSKVKASVDLRLKKSGNGLPSGMDTDSDFE